MENKIYGYLRTSSRRREFEAGSDPDTQRRQLLGEGIALQDIIEDVGVSGGTATSARKGWKKLDGKLEAGDTLVVAALDRIGRRWMETTTALRDLHGRGVRIKSLSAAETWAVSLSADTSSDEGFTANLIVQILTWVAQKEAESISRRTIAGLDRAKAAGKTLGRPPLLSGEQVEALRQLRDSGRSIRSAARAFNVSPTTAASYLNKGS